MNPIRSLYARGYRSIQRLFVPLDRVNVIVGANGTGKTNLYRALTLLSAAAQGRLARAIAVEGGMPSLLWAGERRKGVPKRVTLDVRFDEWSYSFACGLPQLSSATAFTTDPFVRHERLQFLGGDRRIDFFERRNSSAWVRGDNGERRKFPNSLDDAESILSELREPHRFPEMSQLRMALLSWRFYHQFRTDFDSPLRRPQVAVRTPVLGHDGIDIASALQTIIELGDYDSLYRAVAAAFPGGRLEMDPSAAGLEVQLASDEFRRPFAAMELSDGTLKYLCLLAALLSPRPAGLLAFNEPDASLHPQLFEPLAQAIAAAAEHSQIWITTHSRELAALIHRYSGAKLIEIEKRDGATVIVGQDRSDDSPDEPEEENDADEIP